ncbi:MAG: hypothetical protein LBB74_07050 [Chitinispirillales bacterium]|jgi:hypothetical protein|nr:hypothetical protein [Chitinispirillales bacterium]
MARLARPTERRNSLAMESDGRNYIKDMDNTVREYHESTDENLVAFAQSVRDGDFKQPNTRSYSLGTVTERAAADINSLVGVDVTGYKHKIKGGAIQHIENRHGVNGEADKSMADINDYGRIKYVLDNYDDVTLLHNAKGEPILSTGYLGSDGKPSPMIRYEKRVNGNFYVVEAVPSTKTKTLQIVTTYKEKAKSEGAQSLDMVTRAPQFTSEPPPAKPPTTNNITDSGAKSKEKNKKVSDDDSPDTPNTPDGATPKPSTQPPPDRTGGATPSDGSSGLPKIEQPELVEIAKSLFGGIAPKIKRALKRGANGLEYRDGADKRPDESARLGESTLAKGFLRKV